MRHLVSMIVASLLLAGGPVLAIPNRVPEGSLRGYPVIVDPSSKELLANGTHTQWVAGGLLHVKTEFRFKDGRKVTERFSLERGKELRQRSWSWKEVKDGAVTREWEVDFKTGRATGKKVKEGKTKEWRETLKLKDGETFAGGAFAFAVKNLAHRLKDGETVELTAVGATPKPRIVKVQLSKAGEETLPVGGSMTRVDHFVIHPMLPKIATLFVKAPDNHLYFVHSPPTTFVQARGPLIEPGDPTYETAVVAPPRPGSARRSPGR